MKLTHATAIAIAITANAYFFVDASSTCGDCQPSTGYLVTRLWNIMPGTTDQDVIDAFNKGFAPVVTKMDGFYRYTAALTGNSSTVFFMNIFDTEENAHGAQEAAKSFVEEGSLNGKIYPNTFTEDTIIGTFYSSPECVTTSSVGEYLATRQNEYSNLNLYQDGMAGLVDANTFFETIPGYRLFLASVSNDNSTSMFMNIYDTDEGAKQANDAILQQNAEQNYTMGEIDPVTDGQIKFDYLCAAGNAPDNIDNEDDTSKSDSDETEEMGSGASTSSSSSAFFIGNIYSIGVYGTTLLVSMFL